ncbi:hypothetical protein LCGC14_2706210, partial [marine sediment metagenome]
RGMNMKILASGDSTAFCVTVKRDKSSDSDPDDVLEKISSAITGGYASSEFWNSWG